MRDIKIPKYQLLVNKINGKTDFTHFITKKRNKGYIVGFSNLYTGKNPSTEWIDSNFKIKEALENKMYDAIGGWFDPETNLYYVDLSKTYLTLNMAMSTALLLGEKSIYDIKENKVLNVKNYFFKKYE